MTQYTDNIRKIARNILRDGRADMVMGFRRGTVPFMNEPCCIRDPAEADKLVWDGNCGMNLANWLTGRRERIAVIAKGCDSRNIVTHIVENKVKREQLLIIGVPCTGMIDRRAVESLFGEEILEAVESESKIAVRGKSGEKTFDKAEVLQSNCLTCKHPNPVIHDELVAEFVEPACRDDAHEDVAEIERMSDEDRRRFFDKLLEPCIRCYACRNACPLCYCPTCFVDESSPQWVGKSLDETDVKTFHVLRAFHCGGRCTDCGACERACPVGINMRRFTRKLNRDVFELYGWEAGLDLEQRPPLDTYKPEDPEDFIK